MILTCPRCETQYFASDESLVGEGRNVKCTACGHQWTVETPSSAPVSPPQAHEVYLQRKQARARRARGAARTIAWGLSSAIVAGALASAVFFRNEVVRYWPEASTAFAAIGLKVNPFGLIPEDVESARTFEGTLPILNVTGKARNFTRVSQPTPLVRIGLIDERGREISTFTTEFPSELIAPGDSLAFNAVIREPPSEAFLLDVSFMDRDGSGEGERARSGVEADGSGEAVADPVPPAASEDLSAGIDTSQEGDPQ